jgi:hypothetical protein
MGVVSAPEEADDDDDARMRTTRDVRDDDDDTRARTREEDAERTTATHGGRDAVATITRAARTARLEVPKVPAVC